MNEITNAILALVGATVLVCGGLLLTAWLCRDRHFMYIGIAIVALTCCSGYFLIPKPPVYEYTLEKDGCCKVVQLEDLYTWKMQKADGQFVARFCHDYDLSAYDPEPGLIMKRFRYEDLGECWSIRRQDLGFWWLRDEHLKVISEKVN